MKMADIDRQIFQAVKRLSSDEARSLLENYTAVHSMREVVGFWSQSKEAKFKRALGVRAGVIKQRAGKWMQSL